LLCHLDFLFFSPPGNKISKKDCNKKATDNALQAIEKREILRQIMTGEMIIEEQVITVDPKTKKKRTSVIKRTPFFSDKIKAAELDCKISGHFAPNTFKGELTGKNGEPLIPKSEIDYSKLSDEAIDALIAAGQNKRGV